MATLNRISTARTKAIRAGYYIREGAYQNTHDDRLGRWYFGHKDDIGFRPYGAGYATRTEAWEAAFEHSQKNA